jgi:hypothetical protein
MGAAGERKREEGGRERGERERLGEGEKKRESDVE